MADRLTPKELSAIRARHERMLRNPGGHFHPLTPTVFRDRAALLADRDALVDENARLRQDRYDALSVTSKDGLLSSEWIARTGAAERRANAAEQEVERLRGERDGTMLPLQWQPYVEKLEQRAESAEARLTRLVEGLEEVMDTAIRQDDFPDIDRLQAIIKKAQATGEGK